MTAEGLKRGAPVGRIEELEGLNARAIALALANRGCDAECSFREAVGLSGAYSEDDPGIFLPYHATAINNLAKLMHETGNDTEAERLHREALALRREIAFGNSDAGRHRLASSLEGLALVLVSGGRRAEAEPLFREAVEVRRETLRRHPNAVPVRLAGALNNLGAVLLEGGRASEAEPLLREAVDIQRGLVKLDSDTFTEGLPRKLMNLANALERAGKADEAMPLCDEAAALREVGVGPAARPGVRGIDGRASTPVSSIAESSGSAPSWSMLSGRAEGCGRERRVENREMVYPLQPRNGLGHAYRCKARDTGAHALFLRYLDASISGLTLPQAVWVVFRNGEIDHLATFAEYRCELETRIGERISLGIPEERLAEFDAIEGQAEVSRWLRRNRPDYDSIVSRTRVEMAKAIVVKPGEGAEGDSCIEHCDSIG